MVSILWKEYIILFINIGCVIAPHIPVHLGSLSHAVQFQMAHYKENIREGDVIVTNHPQAGGSHLPGQQRY
jgi:5-oxoprolinase (ATP-hydrolysing)